MRGLVALLVLAVAGCGGAAPRASQPAASSAAPTSSTVAGGRVHLTVGHSNPIAETMALYTAKEAAVFDKNGLNVDIRLIAGGSIAMAAVVAGETPFSHLGGSEALSSAVGGADIVVLAITSPVSAFVLEVANDIKTPAELKGKRLGISTIGSSSDIALRVALRMLGLDADKDVSITAVGSTANRLAALLGGSIQGAMELPQDTPKLEASGFHPMLDMGELRVASVGQGIVAQRTYVNGHRDVTQKYIDSIIEAAALARKDRAQSVQIIKKYVQSDDEAAIGRAYDLYQSRTYSPAPLPKPELWNDAVSVLGAKNEAVKNYDLKNLVDPSFVQSAVDRGLSR